MKRLTFWILTLGITGLSFAQDIPRRFFVLNGLGRTVSVMNLETLEITNNILTVGNIPNRIRACGDKIYVVNSTPAGIDIIDGKTGDDLGCPFVGTSTQAIGKHQGKPVAMNLVVDIDTVYMCLWHWLNTSTVL